MNNLLENIDKLHTTPMGVERIKKNLELQTNDVVEWCRTQILKNNAAIDRIGKNWYITVEGRKITVNAHSYTIITARQVEKI